MENNSKKEITTKFNNFSKAIFSNLNVSKTICNHLIDEKHSHSHRMIVGVLIMVIGVSVSKIPVTITMIHFFLDGIGYAIHGIGLIPFIETLSKGTGSNNDKSKEV
jgi:hypothetical protein